VKEVEKIALAALLHDIGKFRQRCGYKDLDDWEMSFAKCDKQKCSYLHAAHTARAIKEMGLDRIDGLVELAASHHKDYLENEEAIMQQADRLASALDRKISLEELKKDDFIEVALQTPFSFVYLDTKPPVSYYPLQKLEGDIELREEKRCNRREKYQKLYEEFIDQANSLDLTFSSFNDFLKLQSLLETYTTFIPASSYKTYPDVSLFDHSLATSAIATAIYKGDGENFSLIQGDFTSIQNFIFSKFGESNKYLAKILRARSLFVNIATDLIGLRIVKELGLAPSSIVLSAGGKFTILAHKLNKKELKKLDEIKNWVNENFTKVNYLQTKFVIKSSDFTKESFELGKFAKEFKKLAHVFEREKLRFEPSKDVFEEYIVEAKNGICKICGIVPCENEGDEICRYCKQFKEIGEKLPKAKYINFSLDDLFSISLDEKPLKDVSYSFEQFPLKRIANIVPKFKKEDIANPKYESIKEETQIRPGAIKTFYHIANDGLEIDENGEIVGKNYLAILKADIDNLGELFIRGFNHDGKNEATFSRVLYLSRMIDYFFTTILMDYIKDKNVYTVFAGGDDLFLIGHYKDIIQTYAWIIGKFKNYTKNKDFHLSAGIHLTRPNVPLNLMAEFAENDLDEAKKMEGKDALTIFDVTVKNDEFEGLLQLIDFFENMYQNLKELGSGKSFMYKFYTFIDMQKHLKENILRNARWKYLLRYLIYKNFEKKSGRAKAELIHQIERLSVLIEKMDEKLVIPLNLYLYSIRK